MATVTIRATGSTTPANSPGIAKVYLAGETITFDDPGNPSATTHLWVLVDVPPGQTSVLVGATTASPTLVLDAPAVGTYRVQYTADGVNIGQLLIAIELDGERIPGYLEEDDARAAITEATWNAGGNTKGWFLAQHEAWSNVLAGAASSLQAAYGVGQAIVTDAGGPVAISRVLADADSTLTVSKVPSGSAAGSALVVTTGANLTGPAMSIVNAGSGAGVLLDAGQLLSPDGAGTAPTYGFSSDLDAGMYLGSVGRVVISAGNNAAMHFLAGKCRVGSSAGSQSSIHISSQGDTNTGVFWGNSDIWGIVTGATEAARWAADQRMTSANGIAIGQGALAVGTPAALLLGTGAVHTSLTNAEAVDVSFDLARTVEFDGVGSFTDQRAFQISAPTYAGEAASITITNAATLYVSGAPVQGANAILTNTYAVWVDSGEARLDGDVLVGGDLNHDGAGVGFYGAAPTAQSGAYTDAGPTPDRALSSNDCSTSELTAVLATLINDLQLTGLIG